MIAFKSSSIIQNPWLFLGTLAVLCTTHAGCRSNHNWIVRERPGNMVETRYMLRGYCYGTTEKGASGKSGALVPLNTEYQQDKTQPYLTADPYVNTDFYGMQGMLLVLGNPTSKAVAFETSDNRLYLVQEAQDRDGCWRPVEYLPWSWCGNSYYDILLPAKHQWSFAVPRYTGSYKTVLRFRLTNGDATIYSNVFAGSIHLSQFSVKQP